MACLLYLVRTGSFNAAIPIRLRGLGIDERNIVFKRDGIPVKPEPRDPELMYSSIPAGKIFLCG